MTDIQGAGGSSSSATIAESCDMAGLPRLLAHIKDPQNLLNYIILSAWMKYMDLFSWFPTITIGG